MTSAHPRITIEPDKRDGKPCIRGMRITVNDILGWLARGMTEAEVLDEHPGLEKADFAAVSAAAQDHSDRALQFPRKGDRRLLRREALRICDFLESDRTVLLLRP